MLVHGQEDDVQGRLNVWAVFVSEDVKEVVEDAFEDERPLQVMLTRDQNLSLARIAGNLKVSKRMKIDRINKEVLTVRHWYFSAADPIGTRTNAWSTLVETGKERYQPPDKLTLELVLANQKQNKLLCLWTMQLTKWAGKVPYLLLLKCSMTNALGLVCCNSCDLLWVELHQRSLLRRFSSSA